MRTDGIDVAPEAVMATKKEFKSVTEIITLKKSRMYKNKAKNAQEALECIRPTDISKTPQTQK